MTIVLSHWILEGLFYRIILISDNSIPLCLVYYRFSLSVSWNASKLYLGGIPFS